MASAGPAASGRRPQPPRKRRAGSPGGCRAREGSDPGHRPRREKTDGGDCRRAEGGVVPGHRPVPRQRRGLRPGPVRALLVVRPRPARRHHLRAHLLAGPLRVPPGAQGRQRRPARGGDRQRRLGHRRLVGGRGVGPRPDPPPATPSRASTTPSSTSSWTRSGRSARALRAWDSSSRRRPRPRALGRRDPPPARAGRGAGRRFHGSGRRTPRETPCPPAPVAAPRPANSASPRHFGERSVYLSRDVTIFQSTRLGENTAQISNPPSASEGA